MDWMRQWRKLCAQRKRHLRQEREERREALKTHREMTLRRERLHRQQQDLSMRLRLLRKTENGNLSPEQKELLDQLASARSELHDIHIRRHLHAYGDEDAMFDRYYRHIRLSRPFVLAINAALWILLFWFGGASVGLKILISFLAILATVGTLYEILFLMRIKDRILLPVDRLRKGVRSITAGQYDVSVENESASEVSSLITAFNQMAQKLQENERLKIEYENNRKALISNISHDLKTPMTSIQGYLEAITADAGMPADRQARYLKIIQSNSAYMNRLIDDLFLFSTLDLQKLEFHFAPVSIRPFLRDMMEEFRLDLEERGALFRYEDALDREYTVDLDPKRFHQILRNLIGNAVKYGPKQGLVVRVKAYVIEENLRLAVKDNGQGIPAKDLPHLFERFYRADPERTKDFSSTGLGLAIAQELAQAHGGKITVASEINAGSCFTVSIPCRAQA